MVKVSKWLFTRMVHPCQSRHWWTGALCRFYLHGHSGRIHPLLVHSLLSASCQSLVSRYWSHSFCWSLEASPSLLKDSSSIVFSWCPPCFSGALSGHSGSFVAVLLLSEPAWKGIVKEMGNYGSSGRWCLSPWVLRDSTSVLKLEKGSIMPPPSVVAPQSLGGKREDGDFWSRLPS